MSVPCSDTETHSASFWSFNHCLLSFTLFSPPCSLVISPFILSVAKCSVVFHYAQLYFAGFIKSHHLSTLPACEKDWMVPSGAATIPYVHCLLAWFTIYIVVFVFFPFVFMVHGVSVLSGIERWVMCGTVAPCPANPPPYAGVLCQDWGDG